MRAMYEPKGTVEKIFMDKPGEGFHCSDCCDDDNAIYNKSHFELYVLRNTLYVKPRRISKPFRAHLISCVRLQNVKRITYNV